MIDGFDPSEGTVVREPPTSGPGCWAGGHKVTWDAASETFVLFYRLRTPIEHGRGAVARVAVGTDGVHFDDVWETTRDELAASSIEVGHCVRHDPSQWRLYVSYEAAASGRWQVDVLEAEAPERFVARARRSVLMPDDFGIGWIKDPWVVRRSDGGYRLYAAVPARTGPTSPGGVLHAGALDATVLAESDDGLRFSTLRFVFEAPGDDSWHGRRARLNCLIEQGDGFLATFDGGRARYDNYEERCGLATSADGLSFSRIETAGPWVDGVRYVQLVRAGDRLLAYYEWTRPDLAHDLRVSDLTHLDL